VDVQNEVPGGQTWADGMRARAWEPITPLPIDPRADWIWPLRSLHNFLVACALTLMATLVLPWYRIETARSTGAGSKTTYAWGFSSTGRVVLFVVCGALMLVGLKLGQHERRTVRWLGALTPIILIYLTAVFGWGIYDHIRYGAVYDFVELLAGVSVEMSVGPYVAFLAIGLGLLAWVGAKVQRSIE
jgi:hypothetical protein